VTRVHGRVVVVTGASGGIGRATALRLARHGATVIGAARDTGRLSRLADEVNVRTKIETMACDVRSAADRRALIEQVLATHGRIDALVNNAGVGFDGLLEDMSLEDVERVVQTNITGLVDLTRLVLPNMLTRGSGDVVNISSVVAWYAAPPLGVYSASKFFVDGFTQALRREVWSRGVKVHSINPGPVATEFGLRSRSMPIEAGSEPGRNGGVPAGWVAAAVERSMTRPWPRTAAVPRVLGLIRATQLLGIRTALDISSTLPLGRRVRPTEPVE